MGGGKKRKKNSLSSRRSGSGCGSGNGSIARLLTLPQEFQCGGHCIVNIHGRGWKFLSRNNSDNRGITMKVATAKKEIIINHWEAVGCS